MVLVGAGTGLEISNPLLTHLVFLFFCAKLLFVFFGKCCFQGSKVTPYFWLVPSSLHERMCHD